MKTLALSGMLFLIGALSVQAAGRSAWPPWPEATLYSYRFNDIDWHPPMVPPAIGFEHAQVQESWSEFALVRDGLSIAPVAVPTIDATGRRTLAPGTGAVRVWFSPINWSSASEGGEGPGHYARLLELVDMSGSTAAVRWSLYVGEMGDTIFFSGTGANGRSKDFLNTRVGFVAGEWQLVTLNYSPGGSQLWLGDVLVAEGTGVPTPTEWQEPSLALIVGSDVGVTYPANGLFEELTTFDYWPDAEQLQFYFKGVSRQVFLGTVGSEEEEAVKQAVLAAAFPQMMLESAGGGMPIAYSYSTNELWLEITGVSNGVANLILHNTDSSVMYEVLSKEELTQIVWVPEQSLAGQSAQDWTAFDIPTGGQTNRLFFRARTDEDSDSDELPDWWELEFFGNLIEGGGDDLDGDGLTNLEEYLAGTHPLSAVTIFVASPKPSAPLP